MFLVPILLDHFGSLIWTLQPSPYDRRSPPPPFPSIPLHLEDPAGKKNVKKRQALQWDGEVKGGISNFQCVRRCIYKFGVAGWILARPNCDSRVEWCFVNWLWMISWRRFKASFIIETWDNQLHLVLVLNCCRTLGFRNYMELHERHVFPSNTGSRGSIRF